MTEPVRTRGEDETMRLAAEFAGGLTGGDVVLLVGELGAGKTRFVRGVACGLGYAAEAVSSPTFVLANEYVDEGKLTLVHVDAYRLGEEDGLDSLETFAGGRVGEAVLLIEWADRLDAGLFRGAPRVWRVELWHAGETEREIVVEDVTASV